MNKQEIISELRSVSGKSISECLKAYNETNNLEQSYELLFRDEIKDIKNRIRTEDEQLITRALIISKNNIDGALSILRCGYDCFAKEKTVYPEFLTQNSKSMAKYDDASWHYGGDYPKDLPNENASTHIGMFLAWCINNDLISAELREDSAKETADVKSHKMTGGEFLRQVCDEKFPDCDLNETGNEFAKNYYDDNTGFGKKYGSYLYDYSETFDKKAEQNGFEYESFYHVEDTAENYNLMKSVIDNRYNEWKEYRKK